MAAAMDQLILLQACTCACIIWFSLHTTHIASATVPLYVCACHCTLSVRATVPLSSYVPLVHYYSLFSLLTVIMVDVCYVATKPCGILLYITYEAYISTFSYCCLHACMPASTRASIAFCTTLMMHVNEWWHAARKAILFLCLRREWYPWTFTRMEVIDRIQHSWNLTSLLATSRRE